MTYSKVNKIQLIIFMMFSNLFFLRFWGFNQYVKHFKNNAYLIPLLMIIIVLIISIFFKGINEKNNIMKRINKSKFIKIILFLYVFFYSTIMNLIFCSLLNSFFYLETPLLLFIIITFLTGVLISTQSFNVIINVGSLLLAPVILVILFVFINIYKNDFLLLLPFNLDFHKLYFMLTPIMFIFDIFIFAVYSDQISGGFKRKDFIITTILKLFHLFLVLLNSLTSHVYSFYLHTSFGSFFTWEFLSPTFLLANKDLVLLYMTTVAVIFRLGLNFNLIRIILNFKKKKQFYAIFCLVLVLSSFALYYFIDTIKLRSGYIITFLTILIFIFYIYICYLSRKKGDLIE